MLNLLFDTGSLLRDAVFPFLQVQDLLNIVQVSKRFHKYMEEFFDTAVDDNDDRKKGADLLRIDKNRMARRGKEVYFYNACKILCSNDISTLIGLLRSNKFRIGSTERKCLCPHMDDRWPNNNTSNTKNLLNDGNIDPATILTLQDIPQYHHQVFILKQLRNLPTWRSVCLRLVDRIQSIEQRSKRKIHVEKEITTTTTTTTYRFGGLLASLIRCKDFKLDYTNRIAETETTEKLPTISAFFVVGSGYLQTFSYFCHEKDLECTRTKEFVPYGLPFFNVQIPVTIGSSHTVKVDVIGTEYGPAGYNPQDCADMIIRAMTMNRGHVKTNKGVFASIRPDILIWGIHVGRRQLRRVTPYHYPTYWMANRVSLREFLLAKGCPCQVLLVLAMHGLYREEEEDEEDRATAQEVEEQLRLSSLSNLGIHWKIQECQISAYNRNNPQRKLQGGSEGLEWAASQFFG